MDLRTTPDRRSLPHADTARPEPSDNGSSLSRGSMVAKPDNAARSKTVGDESASKRSKLRELRRRGKHGWPARYPVAQLPNAPLLAAMAGLSASWVTDDPAHSYARALFYAGLAAWAWGELSEGANLVRRGLGAAGLSYVVLELGTALAGG